MGVLTTVLELFCIGLIAAGIIALAFVFWPAAAVLAGAAGLLVSRELTKRGAA